jgi:hypothetical protein
MVMPFVIGSSFAATRERVAEARVSGMRKEQNRPRQIISFTRTWNQICLSLAIGSFCFPRARLYLLKNESCQSFRGTNLTANENFNRQSDKLLDPTNDGHQTQTGLYRVVTDPSQRLPVIITICSFADITGLMPVRILDRIC